ncbi:MAG: hypothetical protein HZC37_22385 [Burkholderiales bacterium]|nr:hypothetical protein [Burkholderiales bacterium]
MRRGQAARMLGGLVAAIIAAIALVALFRAYQNPANVVQWLALLQLCR